MNVAKELRLIADKIESGAISPAQFLFCTPTWVAGTTKKGVNLDAIDTLRIELIFKDSSTHLRSADSPPHQQDPRT